METEETPSDDASTGGAESDASMQDAKGSADGAAPGAENGIPDSGDKPVQMETGTKISNTSLKTCKVIVELCAIVAAHGVRLAAAGIVGIMKKLGWDTVKDGENPNTLIAMDGGLYEHYIHFSQCLEIALRELLGEIVAGNIVIEHASDGSRIGAALLAASHSQYVDIE